MEHHPGAAIVKHAQQALADGNSVAIWVEGLRDKLMVSKIATDGPFARIEGTNDFALIRLDALIGIHVGTTYKS